MQFTRSQQEVIDARNHNILVSAAAGSGKTAVLVERIVRMISEGPSPLDIDKLLVVTFTRAAAAQIRERIGTAISARLAEDPDNVHLQRQEILLHHAKIMTIDSFCSWLLRESFAEIDLDPGFITMNEAQCAVLENDVLKAFLEKQYEIAAADDGDDKTTAALGDISGIVAASADVKVPDETSGNKDNSGNDTGDDTAKSSKDSGDDTAKSSKDSDDDTAKSSKDSDDDTAKSSKDSGGDTADNSGDSGSGETPREWYARFVECREYFCEGISDIELEQWIRLLYRASNAQPSQKGWLKQHRNDYVIHSADDLMNAGWFQTILEESLQIIREIRDIYDRMIEVSLAPGGPYPYADFLEQEKDALGLEDLEKLCRSGQFSNLPAQTRWTRLRSVVLYSFGRIPTIRSSDESVDPDLKKQVKEDRDHVKEMLTGLKERFFTESPETILERMHIAARPLQTLVDLTLGYIEELAKAKKDKNWLDFADIERCALHILLEEQPDGTYVRREKAKALQQHFAEVLIDEYQDSNNLQELLLTAVTGEAEGRYARFMVGDVKQSIYRFRSARPEIFIDKFDTYLKNDKVTQRIDLDCNFRSRREVLESVNALFTRIMRREIGGVEYDESQTLKFPETKQQQKDVCYQTELLLVRDEEEGDLQSASPTQTGTQGDSEGDVASLPAKKKEALAIAQKIREIVGVLPVDDGQGGTRPATYGDIVILLRSAAGWVDAIRDIFLKEGIPLYVDYRTGYFSAEEIREVMELLKTVCNPRQDIPLYGVLRSWFGGFTEDEIAVIRAESRLYAAAGNGSVESAAAGEVTLNAAAGDSCVDSAAAGEATLNAAAGDSSVDSAAAGETTQSADSGEASQRAADNSLYSALQTCAGLDTALAEKCARFLEQLADWRVKAQYLPVSELIGELVFSSGYEDYVAALPAGAQRVANLSALQVRAAEFETGQTTGLFAFLRYITQMRAHDVDYGEANVLDETADVVRIITIHKSKGLEFPVCFVAGTGSRFAFIGKDPSGKLVCDSDLGIGINYVDVEMRSQITTLRREAIADKIRTDSLGEEIRVLYVAMTRAKEKLYLTGYIGDGKKQMEMLLKHPDTGIPSPQQQALQSGVGNPGPQRQVLQSGVGNPGPQIQALQPGAIRGAHSYLDLILLACAGMGLQPEAEAMQYGDAGVQQEAQSEQFDDDGLQPEECSSSVLQPEKQEVFAPIGIRVVNVSDMTLQKLENQDSLAERRQQLLDMAGLAPDKAPIPALAMELKERFSYRYAHANLSGLFTKTSVSELKRASMEESGITFSGGSSESFTDTAGEGAAEMYPSVETVVPYEPAFIQASLNGEKTSLPPSRKKNDEDEFSLLSSRKSASGADRGTAVHKACELIDFARWPEPGKVTGQMFSEWVAKTVEDGQVTPEQAQMISSRIFLPFLHSGLAARMASASAAGLLRREQPFVLGVPANSLDRSFPAEETILVQGIIDAFFIENGAIVLVDYKTDNVASMEELVDRYHTQINYYAQALERLLHMPVSEKLIYSFRLQETIWIES